MSKADLSLLPDITLCDDEPVFNEPWEAQAFAMVINLHKNGAFEWDEWAKALSDEIHSGGTRSYYQHWLCALEKIVDQKNLASLSDLNERKNAWHEAALATPHGQPITLS